MPARYDSPDTLIVGYPGRLARAFAWKWPRARKSGRAQFDITNHSAVMRALQDERPKLVVNCAGITDMARCEADPDLAWAVNVRGVRNLAEACRTIGGELVHFSSDYALDPVNEYAWTKRASESFAGLTIRAKIYDASHWCWTALRNGQTVRMPTTEYLNPISTPGAVMLVEKVLLRGMRGTIAIGTLERLSFWQVGQIWAKALGADPASVKPVERIETPLPRLQEMFLDTTALQNEGIRIPTLEEDSSALNK